ncbi:tRNA pseudouridine(65) synthase TruC [Candidatus Sulfurimonas marisnigri]|uniref:tRNA pseudouridine synthase C n=1 Tax=Candidatus Sulfurimonas marisnigri TaxID=2740405 RepID=A0A7S7RR11_9BACT|nr:tRNA pseudouridine(65) synthase TruC [Candidatus Sulfurimonas marisnigri]QOY55241.1 tRNA pseudouridine(65) synthase TruC [Candidatus Sulfurimonas marisnigri]
MLEVLYKDEYLVAINKPSGLLVHRSPIDRHETEFAIQQLRDQIGKFVYPVHRLDKPTSGVLLFTLDKESAKLMSEQFRDRETKKTYLAVVRGYIEESGFIDHALVEKLDKIADKKANKDKEPQEAQTEYVRLATVEVPFAVGRYDKTRYSLVKLLPKTGRKHQLRRHMKHISHHILGDTKYGRGEHNKFIRETYDCHRLLLHASELKIKHPYTGELLIINAPLDATCKSIFNSFEWSEILI